MNKSIRIFLIIVIIAGLGIYFLHKPVKSESYYGSYDTNCVPEQINDISEPAFKIKIGRRLELTLSPLAKYRITAKVFSKRKYFSGWSANISPYDLALGWGKLVEPEMKKYIKYSQMSRFYFYKYKYNCPLNQKYISEHSANTHIIPATNNLRKALRLIKKNQLVELNGFLVNITGNYKGGKVWWNTSKTRTDTGDGACEILYLTKLKVGYNVYE